MRQPFFYVILATAAAATAEAAVTEEKDNDKSDYNYPCAVVIEKIAKAIVIHSVLHSAAEAAQF